MSQFSVLSAVCRHRSATRREGWGVRVLVVEDEISLAETIRDGLTGAGFTVDLTHDGAEGLWTAAETPHGAYDVIVLDIMLPKLSGYEVCRQLRTRGVWTPILMLT